MFALPQVWLRSRRAAIRLRLVAPCLWLCLFSGAAMAKPLEIQISGVEGELKDNVEAHVQPPARTDRDALERFREQVVEQAQDGLRALGYYQARVTPALSETEQAYVMDLLIEAGKPVIVESVDLQVEGDARDDERVQRYLDEFPLKKGEVLHHGHYSKGKDGLLSLVLSRGYFDARLTTHKVSVRVKDNAARVELLLASGPRYRFGEVDFDETALSKDLLERFLTFSPGDYYESQLVARLNGKLLDSGYFNGVDVNPRIDEADAEHRIPVEIKLSIKEPNQFRVGLGFATDVGPRFSLGWDKPYLNAQGHRLTTDLEVSRVRTSVSASYRIPLREPLVESLTFQGGVSYEEFEDTKSRLSTVSARREWETETGWRRSVSLSYEVEEFEQGEDSGISHLLLPGTGWSRTRSRGGLDPSWGYRVYTNLQFAEENLLSDVSLVRAQLGGRYLTSLADRHKISVRLDLGGNFADDFTEVPPSLRFFAGGDQSIRGFDYQSIAPKDENGDVVGGKFLTTGSVEYIFRVKGKWSVAWFVDAGDAYDRPDQISWHVGTGPGVRWNSPVGPVRFDLGFGASEQDDLSIRLHFSMGPQL